MRVGGDCFGGRVGWGLRVIAAGSLLGALNGAAIADTLPGALVQAYRNNPTLNSQPITRGAVWAATLMSAVS